VKTSIFVDLPRHIQEHAAHCEECQRQKELCKAGSLLLSNWKTIAGRIDKLPKLSESGRARKEVG
jgi:hypothetical protein